MTLVRMKTDFIMLSYKIIIQTKSKKKYIYSDKLIVWFDKEYCENDIKDKFIILLMKICKIINLEFIEESKRKDCTICVCLNSEKYMEIPYIDYNFTNLKFIKKLYVTEVGDWLNPIAVFLERICPINNFNNLELLLINNCVYPPLFFENWTIPLKTLVLYDLYRCSGFRKNIDVYKYNFDKLPPTIKQLMFCNIDISHYNIHNAIVKIKVDYDVDDGHFQRIKPENILFKIDFFEQKYRKYLGSSVDVVFCDKYKPFENLQYNYDDSNTVLPIIIDDELYKNIYQKMEIYTQKIKNVFTDKSMFDGSLYEIDGAEFFFSKYDSTYNHLFARLKLPNDNVVDVDGIDYLLSKYNIDARDKNLDVIDLSSPTTTDTTSISYIPPTIHKKTKCIIC